MGPSYFFDKSHLSEDIQARQKLKGTFDSPCFSVCDYDGEQEICQTCSMKKSEKRVWKVSEAVEKESIVKNILKRREGE